MASHVQAVPMPNPDESLMTHGETASFEGFFDAERARLFGALSVMTGNRHEAEEIMQDAFLRLWERWERVSAMDEPVGFLYRTAMNLYRKRLRRAAVTLRKATNLLPPDDALAAVETPGQATRLLRTLTPREREALVLTAYLGYSTEEAGRLETRAYGTAPTPSAIQPLRVRHVRAVACEMLQKANVSGR